MATDSFLGQIPVFKSLEEIQVATNLAQVPSEWYLILTDVRGSTRAIERGEYKAVNTLGAASIMAVLNACRETGIPFVFGGDGATLLVPPESLTAVEEALRGVGQLAEERFGMKLRLGRVPVQDLTVKQLPVWVGWLVMSSGAKIAALRGAGLEAAEKWVKSSEEPNPYWIAQTSKKLNPDVSGLECRWQPLNSKKGEILSLIVKARNTVYGGTSTVYLDVLKKISALVGNSDLPNPVAVEQLNLTVSWRQLKFETAFRAKDRSLWARFHYQFQTWLMSLLMKPIFRRGASAFGVDWGQYQKEVALNSDFQKFEEGLKMVLDVTRDQRIQILTYLETLYRAGILFYGSHADPQALLTCLVFNRLGNHVHLVDGNNGGYALAAKGLKAQVANFKDQAANLGRPT